LAKFVSCYRFKTTLNYHCRHTVIMFYRCSLDLLSFFLCSLFSPPVISEVDWPIAIKLCHMVDGDPDLRNSVRHFGDRTPLPNLAAPKHQISARFRTTSRLDREYLRNATRYRQSENGVAKLRIIRSTLIHKRRKTVPEF